MGAGGSVAESHDIAICCQRRCGWALRDRGSSAVHHGGTVHERQSAANALRADDDVVNIPVLGYRGPVVIVVLEHHGVDAVRAEGAEPVEARFLGLQGAVDPVLEHAIGLPGVVELDMRLDTIPLAHMAGVEERRPAVRGPEPREVRAIVVARGRSEEHTSELQSLAYLVCRLLLEKKKTVAASRDPPPRGPAERLRRSPRL